MRVMINSVPKSGTNLVLRLLTLLGFQESDFWIGHYLIGGRFSFVRRALRTRGPEKVVIGVDVPEEISRGWLKARLDNVPDGSCIVAHCVYTEQMAKLLSQQRMRAVCIIRDPRDVAVSHMHYLKKQVQHPLHREYTKLPSDRERLLISIRGGKLGRKNLQPLDQRYRRFLSWELDDNTVLVKFEDLVGSRGGGSAVAQRHTIEQIAAHLSLSVDQHRISTVQDNLFGSTNTFRRGQVGSWRSELPDEHRRAVKSVAGDLLIELGYEDGTDW
jgi:hypothetical protein